MGFSQSPQIAAGKGDDFVNETHETCEVVDGKQKYREFNMIRYKFITNPTKRELEGIVRLYKAAGWWGKSDRPSSIIPILRGSHCFLLAGDGSGVVGMGRAISDGKNDAYIHDVAVAVSMRGCGIGNTIVKKLVTRLKKDRIKWIGLIAAGGSRKFYEKIGFEIMENSAPMLFAATPNSRR